MKNPLKSSLYIKLAVVLIPATIILISLESVFISREIANIVSSRTIARARQSVGFENEKLTFRSFQLLKNRSPELTKEKTEIQNSLSTLVTRLLVAGATGVFVWDDEHNLIASDSENLLHQKFTDEDLAADAPYIAQALLGETVTKLVDKEGLPPGLYSSILGKNFFVIYHPIYATTLGGFEKTITGAVEVVNNWDEVQDAISKTAYYSVGLITFFSTVFFALISRLLFTFVIGPVRSLKSAAEVVGSGNFDYKIESTATDELGDLTKTFNTMRLKLKDFLNALDESRKKTEIERAKDEAILLNIGDGLVFTDLEKRVVLINRAGEEMLGRPHHDVVGKIWSDVVRQKNESGKELSPASLPIQTVIASHDSSVTITALNYLTRKDGTIFPAAITSSKVSIKGTPIGAIEVFRDITKDKEIDKAKTEFVSLASHQLRTPLSAVNWYTEMLLAGDAGTLNDNQIRYLNEIYGSNQRMTKLVNALLNVSRLELGTFMVEPEPVNMMELVYSVLDELKPEIDEKRLIVKKSYDEGVPIIQADPKLIRIVVQNLLTNAVKYTQSEGQLDINVSRLVAGREYGGRKIKEESVGISVSDNGYGITEKQQDQVFTKLFRADNIREKDTEGTGLGLYIVKSIVEHSKGVVWFFSKENKGTAFYVTLPLIGMEKKEGTRKLS